MNNRDRILLWLDPREYAAFHFYDASAWGGYQGGSPGAQSIYDAICNRSKHEPFPPATARPTQ